MNFFIFKITCYKLQIISSIKHFIYPYIVKSQKYQISTGSKNTWNSIQNYEYVIWKVFFPPRLSDKFIMSLVPLITCEFQWSYTDNWATYLGIGMYCTPKGIIILQKRAGEPGIFYYVYMSRAAAVATLPACAQVSRVKERRGTHGGIPSNKVISRPGMASPQLSTLALTASLLFVDVITHFNVYKYFVI